jgi:glycerophosphoryl diester phosphodiesterase
MRTAELWGHRGARGLFPENTLEGIESALALGVGGVEIDIALTEDLVPVLSHDPRLSPDIARGADGRWVQAPGPRIRDLSVADLGRFDVGRLRPGSPTALRFPDQAPRDGARVPTLAAVLALGCRLIIEIKTFPDQPEETAPPAAMAEAVCAAITAAGAADRVIVESFDWRVQREVQRLLPDLALAWLTSAETEAAAALWWDGRAGPPAPEAVAAAGGGTWAPEWTTLTEGRVAEAHALGLDVIAWTVNAADAVPRLAGWGVDGIITDRPDLVRPAMRQADGRLSRTQVP